MTAPVILPSIQEMFPEHLLGIPRSQSQLVQRQPTSYRLPAPKPYERPLPAPLSFPRLPPPPTFSSTSISSRGLSLASGSFDVLQSHPGAKSLTHIASSEARASHSRSPSPGISPSSASSSHPEAQLMTPVELEPGSDDADTADAAAPAATRKHVCPTCWKRFNRPSSLRIHVNTHTGATPFRCPYPGCGRAFNVNSNMRRHLRNHIAAEGGGEQAPTSPYASPIVSPASPTPHSRILVPQPPPRAYPLSGSTSASLSASPSASRSPSPSYTLVSAQAWGRSALSSLAETALRSERARGR